MTDKRKLRYLFDDGVVETDAGIHLISNTIKYMLEDLGDMDEVYMPHGDSKLFHNLLEWHEGTMSCLHSLTFMIISTNGMLCYILFGIRFIPPMPLTLLCIVFI